MAGRTEDDVGGVAGGAFKMAATKVAVDLHLTDCGLDGRAVPPFAFDAAEYAALLAGV